MRSKKQQRKAAPVYRTIRNVPAESKIEPGEIGQAAVTAAALHQLNRYAQDVREYIEDSELSALLEGLQSELDRVNSSGQPKMRLRRE